eukprot:7975358-Pyramimonas_sp.AAC.1
MSLVRPLGLGSARNCVNSCHEGHIITFSQIMNNSAKAGSPSSLPRPAAHHHTQAQNAEGECALARD